MPALYRVIYCSRNRIPGTPDTVSDHISGILARSRENNIRDQVTGGLMFSDGCFAQVLEGPMDAVMAAFERIQCDERHCDVVVLQAGPTAERHFSDWSMAFAGTRALVADKAASLGLSKTLAVRSDGGESMLDLMRSVVVRETEWLAPA
jgi:hypothetical protein